MWSLAAVDWDQDVERRASLPWMARAFKFGGQQRAVFFGKFGEFYRGVDEPLGMVGEIVKLFSRAL